MQTLSVIQGEFVGKAIGESLEQLFFDVLVYLGFIAPVVLIIWIVYKVRKYKVRKK